MQTKRRRFNVTWCLILGLVLLLLIGGKIRNIYDRWNNPPYSGERWRRDQEEKAMEAVFRYQIAENRHGSQICFLSVREAAPSPALMQRFAPMPFVLPTSSRFQWDTGNYKDKKTGLPALHFWITGVDWDTDTELRLKGGGAAANMSGNSGVFTVEWKHGEWHVATYDTEVTY